MIVSAGDFISFLKKLNDGLDDYSEVIVPVKAIRGEKNISFFKHLNENDEVVLDSFRTIDPVKIFYYQPREKVYPTNGNYPKRVIAGIKACDLNALVVLDQALMNEDFVDPLYAKWRDATTVISTDCADVSETCHCSLVNGKPYAESGYDLNLSKIKENYLIRSGSPKGERLVELYKQHFPYREAVEEDNSKVELNRNEMAGSVAEINSRYFRSGNYGELEKANLEDWQSISKECIGCGACTNICPTCYCLILNDESKNQEFVKVRSYDSCQLNGYATVAGGGTPRPQMHQRFRNRYLCKFLYMQENLGMSGCTGCGRCIEACAAGIDLRDVMQEIVENPVLKDVQ